MNVMTIMTIKWQNMSLWEQCDEVRETIADKLDFSTDDDSWSKTCRNFISVFWYFSFYTHLTCHLYRIADCRKNHKLRFKSTFWDKASLSRQLSCNSRSTYVR